MIRARSVSDGWRSPSLALRALYFPLSRTRGLAQLLQHLPERYALDGVELFGL